MISACGSLRYSIQQVISQKTNLPVSHSLNFSFEHALYSGQSFMSHNILCRDEISITSLVSPIHLNDCEMWGCFLKSVGNNYDKFVSRMALGVHSKASNHAVKGELGRFPLHLIIYTRIFQHFVMLLTLPNNQILNSALETNIFNNVGKHLRFTTVRHLLHFTKLTDFSSNLPHLDYKTIPHLVRMFKRNLFKEYQEY